MAKATALLATDPTAALLEARVAISLDPTSLEAARTVARLLQQLSTPEEATLGWERVLDLAPDDPEATEAIKALGGDA